MAATQFNTIAELRDAIVSGVDARYASRMLHPVPDLPTVKNRGAYLVDKARGKIVFDIGCTGLISQAVKRAAAAYYGTDIEPSEGIVGVDLDVEPERLPQYDDVEVVIVSELIEHLSNPGNFLRALKAKYGGRDIIVTVPHAGNYAVRDGCEVVHQEHVAWYSYTTLKALLTRCGFEMREARWYNGEPHKAEGLIARVT